MLSRRLVSTALAVAALSASVASAQVDFNVFTVTEVITTAELEAAAGASSTARVDGIDIHSNGNLFVVHEDLAGEKTFMLINPTTKVASFTKTSTQIAADLGAPYTSSLTLVGELINDPFNGRLVFADNSTATTPPFDYSVLAIDLGTLTATEILRSSAIEGWNSHAVLLSGEIIGALGEGFTGGVPQVGFINETGSTWVTLFDEDDFVTEAGATPGSELPPETLARHRANDDVYVFCHDQLELFVMSDITGTPSLAHLVIPGWNGVVDFHGMAVDENGNIYGFDETAGNENIAIWDGTNTYSVSLDDIAEAINGPAAPPFEVTFWRGIKARMTGASTSDVWLASGTGDYGLVRVSFGGTPSSTTDWHLYQ